MTDTPKEASGKSPRYKINSRFYPLTWEQALRDYADGLITPRGLICYYLQIHLRPGRELLIDVEEFCAMLQINRATYYRAIGALQGLKRINIKRGKMILTLEESFPQGEIPTSQRLSQESDSLSQMRDDLSQKCDSLSQECDDLSQESDSLSQMRDNGNQPKALPGADFRKSANVPNRSIDLKEQQTGPTHHPVLVSVPEGMNREGIGTNSQGPDNNPEPNPEPNPELDQLLKLSQLAGIELNKTIADRIQKVLDESENFAEARRKVENAISSLKEQGNKLRNPSGFFVAALEREFTANAAKREARQRPTPPDLNQISAAIDHAILRGDRTWAITKLQTLWDEGWHNEVEELYTLRRDWGFSLTDGGPQP